MQVVPGAPGASCAAVASAPARRRRRRGPRATRDRKPLELSYWEDERLNNKINRVVCSEPWYRHCKQAIQSGEVAYKDDQAKELRRRGVYPPGGVLTRMEKCGCGHWCPPARYVRERHVEPLRDENGKPTGQVKVTYTPWLPICLDCYYAAMPLFEQVRVQSSKPIARQVKDAEFPAHLEGSGWQRRSKRRRYVGDGGVLQETIVTDDGETYDLVVMVPPAPGDSGGAGAATFAGNEA